MAPSAHQEQLYNQLVASLSSEEILTKWSEVTPLKSISGVPTSSSSSNDETQGLFEGHDQEQIKLMEELCIVLDYNDTPIGAGTKKLCHIMDNINQGLLHRAFSVFLFNEKNELLLQQRADEKITFPAMWTNTCCSHPLCIKSEMGISKENENSSALEQAIDGAKIAAQRKLDHELGIPLRDCEYANFQYLTRIHYKSASGDESSKWGEHEIDYILILKSENPSVNANPNEVKDYKYVNQEQLKQMFKDESLVFTPWFKLICETFLFNWWNNLDNLNSFQDDKIHRML